MSGDVRTTTSQIGSTRNMAWTVIPTTSDTLTLWLHFLNPDPVDNKRMGSAGKIECCAALTIGTLKRAGRRGRRVDLDARVREHPSICIRYLDDDAALSRFLNFRILAVKQIGVHLLGQPPNRILTGMIWVA